MGDATGPADRLEPIATLPVFFKLAGKRAVLAGGSAPAVWKAELLSAAGAQVDVYADEVEAGLLALAERPPAGPIHITRRAWQPGDLAGAAIALGAIQDDAEAERFRTAARAAGVPVNVIDKPAFCDFQFGTIVSRSPLVIGISTDGAAPVFGQAIRARIEALLPQAVRAWAEAAQAWRPIVQARGLDFRRRRRFWSVFAERAMAAGDRAPGPDDLAACLDAIDEATPMPQASSLTLVGAGTGDPDTVTLAAVRAMQDADIVCFGQEVTAPVINLARREAEKVAVPGGNAAVAAVEACWASGRRVVWIDAGDPATCLRWRERATALGDRNIAMTMVGGLGLCEACGPACPRWTGGVPV